MQGFDLDQLRTLVAAVDAGSLSAAAPVRLLSQSTLSEQLRKLEERAGQTLLQRSKTGVVPTAAGERLLAHARQILALSDAAWRDLHGVSLEGEVRLGITGYFRASELIHLLARLGQQYPRLRLRTQIGKSDDIEAAYNRQALDLAIVMRVAERPIGEARVLRREPLVWAASPKNMLISANEPIPLALLPESCSLHRLARMQLDAHRQSYVVNHVASDVAGIQAAVAAGLGVACINASSLIRDSMVALADPALPPLPDVTFALLPPVSSKAQQAERLNALAEVVAQALMSSPPSTTAS
ncbi:LysR family transcriptional regulator [Stutzerimonas stutzeri]|uniref:LysR family transcriptional regulator n=1 Tax=Stutzerimonas stutzeri TaxID=316 RepID=W8QTC3_STUST|nr:LysR family transcriptional regulator [Stutzerimonas stutzeri]AHL73805.1 LysR family transcriptional regulator [Stutzerimonas stutzeri]MCQ4328679.1 LysR family transcriptional regulator [Stutzerimonas stutzeri]